MKKVSLDQNNEVDLLRLIVNIWENKYKFITIILLVTLFFFINNQRHPIEYRVTTEVRLGDHSDFIKYINLNKILILTTEPLTLNQENRSTFYQLKPDVIFNLAFDEFSDYEELILVLKKYPYVQKMIQELSKNEAEVKLASLAKKFKIKAPKNQDSYQNFELTLTWHDAQEGIAIFKETLAIVLINIKKKITDDVNQLLSSNYAYKKFELKNLEIQSENTIRLGRIKNQSRIKFLEYHLEIAKKLGILKIDDQIRNSTNMEYSNSSQYYLMGSDAINMEIGLMKDLEKDKEFLGQYGQEYTKLQIQKNKILNYQIPSEILEIIKLIKNDNEKRWIDYDFNFATIQKNKEFTFSSLLFGVFLGFVVASAYLFIIHILQLLNQSKRAKN